MSQRCSTCGEVKDEAEFSWHRKTTSRRNSACRACHAAYRRRHYLANRQRYIDKAQRQKDKIKVERWRVLLDLFLAHPCADCGEPDPLVLEFDHVRGVKSFNVSQGLVNRPWRDVLDEIAKCDIVCANCHRRRTISRGGFLRAALLETAVGDGEAVDPDRR